MPRISSGVRASPRFSQKILPQNYVLGALSKKISSKNISTHIRSLITSPQYFKIGHVIIIRPCLPLALTLHVTAAGQAMVVTSGPLENPVAARPSRDVAAEG